MHTFMIDYLPWSTQILDMSFTNTGQSKIEQIQTKTDITVSTQDHWQKTETLIQIISA